MKKGTYFDDKGVPYVKAIWIRMNLKAHENFLRNYESLNVSLMASKIEIKRAKDKKKKT